MSRGIKHEVDRFIRELSSQYVPFMYPDKNGDLKPEVLQVGVRPIQLWECVFPETHRDLMLRTILGESAETQHPRHQKFIWALRKILGIKPVGEYKKDKFLPIQRKHIETIGIGEKADYWVKGGEKFDKQVSGAWEGI